MEAPNGNNDWNAWLEAHGPRLLFFARQQARTRADAEDILQTALVNLVRRHPQPSDALVGPAFGAVRRVAVDFARREQRRQRREDAAAAAAPDHEPPAFAAAAGGDPEEARAVAAALTALPAPQREVVVMKVWGEQTFEAIAQALGQSPNTVASRYRYALSALRKIFVPRSP